MSTKYPGGIFSKTAVVPSGGWATASASGIWTIDQVEYWLGQSLWPTPGVAAPQQLWSTGNNDYGQLGLGNRTKYSSPKQVGSLTTWAKLNTGNSNSGVAIKSDGTLWSWGRNNSGQLGLGNVTYYSSPKQVGALTNWLSISSSVSVAAIKTDGTLWTWGDNSSGQLGQGNITGYSSPKQVGALTNWSKVSSGANSFIVAVKTNGTLWSCGDNQYGSLGDGTSTKKSSPVQVGSLTNWADVSCGDYHSIAVKTDGTLWAWGLNDNGQLGLGNTTYSYSSPKQVGSLTTWSIISAGGRQSFSIKTNGALWSWGQNAYGQLGLGNITYYSSPKQVGALTNWSQINSSAYNVMAITTAGALWGWGFNIQGALGFGNNTKYSSPKQVGALTTWVAIAPGANFSTVIKSV
jgi:alpha-tubulin suppressor-like RCC1 family protein